MTDENNTIRLFTALSVPPRLKEQVASLPHRGIENGKWLHAEDLHVTIRYLGHVSPEKIPEIEKHLLRIKRPAFHLEMRGLDCFKNERQSILYAPIESVKKLTTLCAEVTDRLTPLGFDFGTRPYVPHMTLGRFKKSQNSALDHFIAKNRDKIHAHWKVMDFHLIQSSPADESGRRYRVLSSFPLV